MESKQFAVAEQALVYILQLALVSKRSKILNCKDKLSKGK